MKLLNPKDIEARFDKLKSERANWETLWQDIADLMYPRKNTIITQRSPGEDRNVQIFDNTGIQALELFAAALHSFLTNPHSEWFELTTGDLALDTRDDVRKFLQLTTRDIHNVINNSNFQTEVHELYMDMGSFGTSPMAVEEDDEFLVRFSTRFLADVCVAENHMGVIDELYFEFKWTARKLVAKYGKEKLPEKVLKAYEKDTDDLFRVIFCVYPKAYEADQKIGFNFISKEVLCGENVTLKTQGFHEFPYVVPRFSKASGETYGRSPAMNALPEVKVLNLMTEITLEGAQKVIDPPLQAPDDGFILNVNTYPAGITHYRAGSTDRVEPIFNDSRVDFGFEAIKNSQEKVRNAFYVNQFQMGDGPSSTARTATEISYKAEENFRFLGPMMGRMQTEFLQPLINRIAMIMMRKGKIKNIPLVLSNRKIMARYSSFIARAQRTTEANNVLKFMQAGAPFFQADPRSLNLINSKGSLKVLARSFGAPQEMFNTEDEIAQIEKQQQALAEQQKKTQEQQNNADVAAKVLPAAAAATQQGA